MDIWNKDITFVTQKKWKMWTQKNAKVVFKLKLKNKHYQMKNLLNNDITFVTQKKWKMWTQKNVKVVFKLKLKNKHYQMKNL